MPDSMTTTNRGGTVADDAVAEAVENLRQAMLDADMDPETVEAQLRAAIPNQTNLVGNLADLQRLGALVADEEVDNADVLAEAVVVPPEAETDEGEAVAAEEGGYETWTKAELQAAADEQGVETTSAMTKADLVAALEG